MIVLSAIALPVYAKGKPADPGGGKPDKDTSGLVVESVCIDPGHGGDQPGAVSSNSKIEESKLNLDVALKLEEILESNHIEAELTRRTDEDGQSWSNNDRYTFCNKENTSILISIHHNGSTDPTVDYSLGLYHQGSSRELATVITDAVATEFGIDNEGIDRFPSGVLIKSDMPSMMSEGYFLTNEKRERALEGEGYNDEVLREANALYEGIATYSAT